MGSATWRTSSKMVTDSSWSSASGENTKATWDPPSTSPATGSPEVMLNQANVDVGRSRAEVPDDVPHLRDRAGSGRESDDEAPRPTCTDTLNSLDGLGGAVERVPGTDEELLARRRECHLPRAPREESRPKIPLQVANRRAQGLLGEVDAFRGAREVELFRDRHEVGEVPQLEPVRR